MDVFCPRCNVSLPQASETVLQKGRCPTCGGQLSIGGVTTDLPVDGAVAMTFQVGSRVAVPLDATFSSKALDLSGAATAGGAKSSSRPRPPPPPQDDIVVPSAGGELRLPAHLAVLSAELTAVPAGDPPPPPLVSPSPAPPSVDLGSVAFPSLERSPSDAAKRKPVAASKKTMDDERPPPAPPRFDTAPTVTDFKPPEFGSPPGSPPAAAAEDPAPTPAHLAVAAEGAQTPADAAPAAPAAHLQLPSIDFSIPSFSTAKTDASPPRASAGPPPDLPAHLQLPNFPDFKLPPIPGEEKDPRATGDFTIEGVAGGSFDAMQASAPAPAAQSTGKAEDWSVPSAGAPAVPPPLPAAPPPLKPRPKPAAAPAPGGLPDLPALGLPSLQVPAQKRDPTLLASDAARALLADAQRKKFSLGIAFAVVLVIALVGVGGALAYYGPDTVASWFTGEQKVKVERTARDLADEQLFLGKKAYLAGEEAEKAKKAGEASSAYREAIGFFEKALEIDPTMGQVHRNLGIAYAKSNQQAKAVDHYQLYLDKVPDAKDRDDVRKIIDDYKKAQEKKKSKK